MIMYKEKQKYLLQLNKYLVVLLETIYKYVYIKTLSIEIVFICLIM